MARFTALHRFNQKEIINFYITNFLPVKNISDVKTGFCYTLAIDWLCNDKQSNMDMNKEPDNYLDYYKCFLGTSINQNLLKEPATIAYFNKIIILFNEYKRLYKETFNKTYPQLMEHIVPIIIATDNAILVCDRVIDAELTLNVDNAMLAGYGKYIFNKYFDSFNDDNMISNVRWFLHDISTAALMKIYFGDPQQSPPKELAAHSIAIRKIPTSTNVLFFDPNIGFYEIQIEDMDAFLNYIFETGYKNVHHIQLTGL